MQKMLESNKSESNDTDRNKQLSPDEFKSVMKDRLEGGATIGVMNFICDLKYAIDVLGKLAFPFIAICICGVAVFIGSLLIPYMDIRTLIIIVLMAIAAQAIVQLFAGGWVNLVTKLSCRELLKYLKKDNLVRRVSILWKQYSPESEKHGKHYQQILGNIKKVKPYEAVYILHNLRLWISEEEKRIRQKEEEDKRAEEYSLKANLNE